MIKPLPSPPLTRLSRTGTTEPTGPMFSSEHVFEGTIRRLTAPARRTRSATISFMPNLMHIFSHIRKTYRVQWVLLEGDTDEGDGPPALVRSPDLGKYEDAKPKTSKGQASRKNRTNASASAKLQAQAQAR